MSRSSFALLIARERFAWITAAAAFFFLAIGTLPAAPLDSAAAPRPALLGADEFLAPVAEQLAAHYGVSGELRLDPLRPWTPLRVASPNWEVRVVAPPAGGLASNMLVRCRLLVDGQSVGEWNLAVRAQLLADAWVVRQPLARHEPLATEQLDLRRVDLLRERDTIPVDTDLAAFAVGRPLPTGTVLSWRDVARRPLVRRGETIEVAALSGGLAVTLKAVAMQNGTLGEAIVVRNPASRRDFTAIVVGEQRAEIRF